MKRHFKPTKNQSCNLMKFNKINRSATLCGIALGAAFLSASAQAAVIFSDSFNRTGDVSGSAPDVRPGTETWTAPSNWKTDGTQAKHDVTGATGGQHFMLPFTPQAGNIYRLEAEIDANANNKGWFVGIGFHGSVYQGSFPTGANPYIMESRNAWGAYMPLGSNENNPVVSGSASAGVSEMYAIELDTQNTLWTVSFFAHGATTPNYSTTYTTNPTIEGVGIMTWAPSYDGSAAFVDNFELSAIPEPSSLALLGLGGLLIVSRRRRD